MRAPSTFPIAPSLKYLLQIFIALDVCLSKHEGVMRIIREITIHTELFQNNELPIHRAIARSQLGAVKLLATGSDLELESGDGCRCLHLAAIGGSLPIIQFLHSKGVDMCAVNKKVSHLDKSSSLQQCTAHEKPHFNCQSGLSLTDTYTYIAIHCCSFR